MREPSFKRLGPLAPVRGLGVALLLFASAASALAQAGGGSAVVALAGGQFEVKLGAGAIVSLRPASDGVKTEYVQAGRRLGDVLIRYRGKDGAWQSAETEQLAQGDSGTFTPGADGKSYTAEYVVKYAPAGSNTAPRPQARSNTCPPGRRSATSTRRLPNRPK